MDEENEGKRGEKKKEKWKKERRQGPVFRWLSFSPPAPKCSGACIALPMTNCLRV
jgi:hypothetical protein